MKIMLLLEPHELAQLPPSLLSQLQIPPATMLHAVPPLVDHAPIWATVSRQSDPSTVPPWPVVPVPPTNVSHTYPMGQTAVSEVRLPTPVATYVPPVSTAAPVMNGGVPTFLPTVPRHMDLTQVSNAVDIMSGVKIDVAAPLSPAMPDFSSAPQVTSVPAFGPPASQVVAPLAVTRQAAIQTAIRMYNDPGKRDILAQALSNSGIGAFNNITDANAGELMLHIHTIGGMA